jgi:hypothetical protein
MKEPIEELPMYDLLDAVSAAIVASTPERRLAITAAIERYAEHRPQDFAWAIGGQSPALLQRLLISIRGSSCSRPMEAIGQRLY